VFAYIGGPLHGQRIDKHQTGAWPTYRTETGGTMKPERGDVLLRNGRTDFYLRDTDTKRAAELNLSPDDGRVYVHGSLVARGATTATPATTATS
jgi:hypothetical protein